MKFNFTLKKKLTLAIIVFLAMFSLSIAAQQVQFSFKGGVENVRLKSVMQSNTSTLLSAINSSVESNSLKITCNSNVITKEGLDQINCLWTKVPFKIDSIHIQDAYCLQKKIGGKLVGYEVRHIEISMMPKSPKDWEDDLAQEICLDYDLDGKICFFTLSMEWHSVKKMLKYGEQVGEIDQRFQKVVGFCEQLMTAYCNKDAGTISKLYDKRAIVVVGRKIGYDKFAYSKISGEQYVRNLTNQFTKIGDLKVKFDDYEIVQHPQDPLLYVVTFKQDWFSKYKNNRVYKDCGYVCLVWDFHNEERPIIHFRSWQPIETKSKDIINVRHPEVATLPVD